MWALMVKVTIDHYALGSAFPEKNMYKLLHMGMD